MRPPSSAAATVHGLSNFRDFGGLALGAGHRMVSGRLYRSEHTHGLDTEGVRRLQELGIATLIDLRGSQERANSLPPAIENLAVYSAPVEPRTGPRLANLRQEGRLSRALTREIMIDSYRGYVRDALHEFGGAIAAIVRHAGQPLVLHCTAGKDRTGFTVAVIQAALGASWVDIEEGYLRTNALLDRARLNGHVDMDSDAMEPMLIADTEYLAAAFDEISRRHRSVQAFLSAATRGAVHAEDLQALCEVSTDHS